MSDFDPKRFPKFDPNGNASDVGLTSVDKHFGCSLPLDYKEFMLATDGGEGFIGEEYVVIWRASELIEFNNDYEVAKYAPQLLLFGSNGGSEAFGFDRGDNDSGVVMVPLIGMSVKDAIKVAENFSKFLERLSNREQLF